MSQSSDPPNPKPVKETPPPLAERSHADPEAFSESTQETIAKRLEEISGFFSSRQVADNAFKQAVDEALPRNPDLVHPNNIIQPSSRLLARYRIFHLLANHPKISGWSGLAVAVAAIGFELSGAAWLAAFCFFVSWAIWALGIYFSTWWEKQPRLAAATAVLIGVGSGLFWWSYRPVSQTSAEQIAEEVWKKAPPILTSSPTVSQTSPIFHLRHQGAFVLATFPQPLLYKYNAGQATFFAPIGLALNLQVTNNKSIKTKIVEYAADIQTPDGWFRVLSMPMVPSHDIYFLNDYDIRHGFKTNGFRPIFDSAVLNKTLDPGEPVEGWMFFEWPLELRHKTIVVSKIKITIKNSLEETTETVFDNDAAPPDRGVSQLDQGGGLGRGEAEPEIDLSNVTIKPLRN
ncbi:MAG TPA: hypothetical protein DC047_03465 [Blastocatellia bacterium]|nr:hypothetical protein [Blastocatellia bacterium]